MRILLSTSSFPPEVGGIQNHVWHLSRAFVRQGHSVTIVTARRDRHLALREIIDGVTVFRIPLARIPRTMTAQYLGLLGPALAAAAWHAHADVVHYHMFWPDVFTAGLLRQYAPVVYTIHESAFLAAAEQPARHRMLRLGMRPCDALIAPSTEILTIARRFAPGHVPGFFIPNAVEAELFLIDSGEAARMRLGIGSEQILLLCPRRLVPKNGVEFFIRAIPAIVQVHPHIHALVAGDGTERAALERLAHELDVAHYVTFAGSINNQAMPEVYAGADLVVLPSLMEATSIAGLEAMAAGKPIVATNVGGLPEIITDNQTGLLVPPRDPQALADRLIRLIADPALRTLIGQAARKRVEHEFTWDRVARKTRAVYAIAGAHHARALLHITH